MKNYCKHCGLRLSKCPAQKGKRHDLRKFWKTYCEECGEPESGLMFMLKDKVWLAVAKKDERLCITCAYKRLGRLPKASDFTDAFCNQKWLAKTFLGHFH